MLYLDASLHNSHDEPSLPLYTFHVSYITDIHINQALTTVLSMLSTCPMYRICGYFLLCISLQMQSHVLSYSHLNCRRRNRTFDLQLRRLTSFHCSILLYLCDVAQCRLLPRAFYRLCSGRRKASGFRQMLSAIFHYSLLLQIASSAL